MERIDFVERILAALSRTHGRLTAAQAAKFAGRSADRVRHVFTQQTGMSFRVARLRARLTRLQPC